MLFLATAEMDDACGGTHLRKHLKGAFYHSPLLALAFSLGAINLVGVPLRVVVSPKGLKNGTIEISARDKSMQERKPVEEAVEVEQ